MKYSIPFVIVVVLCGCTTTRVIDADWSDPAIGQRIEQIGERGTAHVRVRGHDDSYAGTFVVSDSSLDLLNPRFEIELGQVAEIKNTLSDRRGLGPLYGAFAGTAAGIGLGAASISGDDCPTDEMICEVGEDLFDATVVVATGVLGCVVGGAIGALIGSPRVEVYRFRPETPRQISVVIGVSPPISAPNRGLVGLRWLH